MQCDNFPLPTIYSHQDTQWNDIDYMNMDLDFTYSTAFGDIQGLVSDLHSHSQKYVLIVVSE